MSFILKAGVTLVTVAVALLCLAQVVDPMTLPGLVLANYLPFPVYLLPVLAALLASVWLGWAWRAVALINLVVTLTLVMGWAWGHADEGEGRVRFMTYNVKAYIASQHADGYAKLAIEVTEQQPDVIVMQDASIMAFDEPGEPRNALEQVVRQGRYVFQSGQYVVASRWPLRDCHLGGIPFEGQTHGFLTCQADIHGVRVNIVTVHFLSPRDGLNAARKEGVDGMGDWQQNLLNRLQQTSLLAQHLRDMSGPVVLGGDLNAPEASAVVQTLLDTGLRDAFSSAGWGYGYTHGHSLIKGLSFLRIDHILVSKDIGVVNAFAGGAEGSQHRPVIADLVMRRQ